MQAVNEVGVDINAVINEKHLEPMLQFVSGLGPRKSRHILEVLRNEDNFRNKKDQKLQNRKNLYFEYYKKTTKGTGAVEDNQEK